MSYMLEAGDPLAVTIRGEPRVLSQGDPFVLQVAARGPLTAVVSVAKR